MDEEARRALENVARDYARFFKHLEENDISAQRLVKAVAVTDAIRSLGTAPEIENFIRSLGPPEQIRRRREATEQWIRSVEQMSRDIEDLKKQVTEMSQLVESYKGILTTASFLVRAAGWMAAIAGGWFAFKSIITEFFKGAP